MFVDHRIATDQGARRVTRTAGCSDRTIIRHRGSRIARLTALAYLLLLLLAPAAATQELEPRSYSNVPVGSNFLVLGSFYTNGAVLPDPTAPLEDVDATIQGVLLGYARSLDMWGRSGKISLGQPYACFSGTGSFKGEPGERDVCGLGDTLVRLSYNFYGAPALSWSEFAGHKHGIVIGAGLRFVVPTGQYDGDKLINVGTNRWRIQPELGLSKRINRWWLEISAGVSFYTDNNDYFGGSTREQAPLYNTQGHIVYVFPKGIWMALDGNLFAGGATTLNGVENDDDFRNSRWGLTLSVPITRRHSIKFYGVKGILARDGAEEASTLGMAYQYGWGKEFPR
jgi:hypothetical protein